MVLEKVAGTLGYVVYFSRLLIDVDSVCHSRQRVGADMGRRVEEIEDRGAATLHCVVKACLQCYGGRGEPCRKMAFEARPRFEMPGLAWL